MINSVWKSTFWFSREKKTDNSGLLPIFEVTNSFTVLKMWLVQYVLIVLIVFCCDLVKKNLFFL